MQNADILTLLCVERGPLEEIAVVGQAYDIFDPLDEWYVAGLLAEAGRAGV